jgi:hypothetical protein
MPRNGNGVFDLLTNSWNPAINGNSAVPSDWQDLIDDVAASITQSVSADGQTPMVGDLNMNGNRIEVVANGVANTDAATVGQIYSQGSETDVASAGTVDLGIVNSNFVRITGTTTITSLGTNYNGPRFVRFADALTLTHNATTLLLPGEANIVTSANDRAIFVPKGTPSDGWLCVVYEEAFVPPPPVVDATIVNDFRLTLTTSVPVTTSDVVGASTIYCTPYKGNQITLYDGTNWNLVTSSQFSLALSGLTSGKPYDVFCYDNAGTATLEFLVWTNDTTRATALAYQDGVLIKSGDATRRYLGTFYTTGTTTTEDSAAKRYLWNYYNRVRRTMSRLETTASWTYTTAAFRQANGSALNQLNYVCGLAEDEVEATVQASATSSAGSAYMQVGIGVDSTTTGSGLSGRQGQPTNALVQTATASYRGIPGVGLHALVWLELSIATGTQTWTGQNTPIQSGIIGSILS